MKIAASWPAPLVRDAGRVTAVVDEELCACCGICVDVCPMQAITLDGRVVIDSSRCTACGACIAECPDQALSFGRRLPARVARG
jgi:ferredoxin